MTIESKLSIVMNQGILSIEGFTGANGEPLFLVVLCFSFPQAGWKLLGKRGSRGNMQVALSDERRKTLD